MIGKGTTRNGDPCHVERGHNFRIDINGKPVKRFEHLYARWGVAGSISKLYMYHESGKGRFPVTVYES